MDNNQIIIYQTEDGLTKIDVTLENETVWLNQAQMAELFQTTKQNISYHINNCFKEGELNENSVVKDFLTTAADGKPYNTHYYNLDVIKMRVPYLTRWRLRKQKRSMTFIASKQRMNCPRSKKIFSTE